MIKKHKKRNPSSHQFNNINKRVPKDRIEEEEKVLNFSPKLDPKKTFERLKPIIIKTLNLSKKGNLKENSKFERNTVSKNFFTKMIISFPKTSKKESKMLLKKTSLKLIP